MLTVRNLKVGKSRTCCISHNSRSAAHSSLVHLLLRPSDETNDEERGVPAEKTLIVEERLIY